MVASVLLILENSGEDKHVESVWLPRLDEGSTPSSSTFIRILPGDKVTVEMSPYDLSKGRITWRSK